MSLNSDEAHLQKQEFTFDQHTKLKENLKYKLYWIYKI